MNSKKKGNSFELDICKKLSRWVTEDERDDIFVRNVTSGAAFTSARKRGQAKYQPGDILATEARSDEFLSHFFVECKHWQDLELDLALRRKGLFYSVVKDCEALSLALGKEYLLIVKQNNRAVMLLMSSAIGSRLNNHRRGILQYHVLWNGRVCMCLLEDALVTGHMKFIDFKRELGNERK